MNRKKPREVVAMRHGRKAGWMAALFATGMTLSVFAAEKAVMVGNESCMTCHQEQGEKFEKSFHSRMFEEKHIDKTKSCESCHGAGSLHVEAAGDKKHPGFATIRSPKNESKRLAESCLTCHSKSHPNWQESAHARKGVTCVSCHSVHQEKSPGIPSNALLKKSTTTETCYTCHKDKEAHIKRAAHMPIKEGAMTCGSCHDPHGTPFAKQLKAAKPNELCFSCHAEKRGPFLWDHPPVAENCMTCHDAHGSLHDRMLNSKRPTVLCQKCHVTGRHPATVYDQTQINNQSNRVVGRSCLNCHPQVHGSNHPSGKWFTR